MIAARKEDGCSHVHPESPMNPFRPSVLPPFRPFALPVVSARSLSLGSPRLASPRLASPRKSSPSISIISARMHARAPLTLRGYVRLLKKAKETRARFITRSLSAVLSARERVQARVFIVARTNRECAVITNSNVVGSSGCFRSTSKDRDVATMLLCSMSVVVTQRMIDLD
jgi:hypothetical protein